MPAHVSNIVKPIAIWFHGLFHINGQLSEHAFNVIQSQMAMMEASGLINAAAEIHCGVNGGEESIPFAETVFPEKSVKMYHGLQCHNECRTIAEMEKWLKSHPDWYVLYLHAKGSVTMCDLNERWRACMMRTCVERWRECVKELDRGYEVVGSHWWTHAEQRYMAGTFFWATSNFLRTIPPIHERARIKESGIDAVESRYEAECWLGNGRCPKYKEMAKGHALMRCP